MSGIFLVLPVFSALAYDLEGATEFAVGLSFGIYGLTQGLLQLPFGILSDRYGRKIVLFFAFSVFLLGTVVCATAENMTAMFVGRLLQGAGAVSSTVFALIADVTRPEVRTRANALLGTGVGLSFALSFVLAPFLGEYFGLSGVFWTIALMGLLSLAVLAVFVPSPPVASGSFSNFDMIKTTLANRSLRCLFLGSLAGGCGLSVVMFLAPLELKKMGVGLFDLWKIYLPMLALGALFMIPSAIIAETKKRYREVFFVGIFLFIASAVFGMAVYSQDAGFWGVLILLYVFFCGYNVFEPLFPSLSTKLATPETKGTVSGMMNFFQFVGYFLGSTLAGLFTTPDSSWCSVSC